jgi:hypothetical protein
LHSSCGEGVAQGRAQGLLPILRREAKGQDAMTEEVLRLREFEESVRAALEAKSLREVRAALRKLDIEDSIAKRKDKTT